MNILDDETKLHCVRVSFSVPLVNPFGGGVFGLRDKLDELSNYFIGPDDEVAINKAHKEGPNIVFLMGFWCVMDVSNLCF